MFLVTELPSVRAGLTSGEDRTVRVQGFVSLVDGVRRREHRARTLAGSAMLVFSEESAVSLLPTLKGRGRHGQRLCLDGRVSEMQSMWKISTSKLGNAAARSSHDKTEVALSLKPHGSGRV